MHSLSSNEAAGERGVRYSIVILTWMRDQTLRATLARLKAALGGRDDVEIVLVDNNADAIDRAAFLAEFAAGCVVRTAFNKGVSARNDGMAVARGDILVLLDDDVLPQTDDFLDRFGETFDAYPDIGLISVRKLDAKTMTQLRECIPHSRKDVDPTAPFCTFRFVGGLIALRRAVYAQVGGFSPEFFFGGEEREYSFRIIDAGWKMYYRPDIIALETNDPGGRRPLIELTTETTANYHIIAYLYKPFWPLALSLVLYPIYSFLKERGQMRLLSSYAKFIAWLRRPDRTRRRPLGRLALAYIRACGGSIWR
jgi:GT2 family glycosyltransferase